MAAVRAFGILALLIPLSLIGIPMQWLALRLRSTLRKKIPCLYHRLVCRIMGLRVTVIGTPATGGVLLAANHSGWLDIPVLSSVQPVSFIAKEEIDAWFFFGLLARLQETVFIRREERRKVTKDLERIRGRLRAGEALVIFPEGTSTDGNRVRPFKSALLGAAELPVAEDAAHHVLHPAVQPVSVAYVGLHGIPMGRESRPFAAWYGDMDLVPHLWEALRRGPIDAVIEFHPLLTVDTAGGRKQLAATAETMVRAGLVRALRGGDPLPPPGASEDESSAALREAEDDVEAA